VYALNQTAGYLSFQGLRVFYRAAEPEGELKHRVLCLSSPFTSTFSWRKLAPELTELGCLMLMVDLPGFGRSDYDRALPGDAETRAHLVWGVLDEIDQRHAFFGNMCDEIVATAMKYRIAHRIRAMYPRLSDEEGVAAFKLYLLGIIGIMEGTTAREDARIVNLVLLSVH
jgi:pimeloyl-ACP methyl ester carboxylesterase